MTLAIIVAVCFLLETAITFVYLRERDKRERAERRELYNRIQAPEFAPTLATEPASDAPLWVPADDDSAFAEYEEARKAGEVS